MNFQWKVAISVESNSVIHQVVHFSVILHDSKNTRNKTRYCDTTIFRIVESQEDRHKLQVDLNNLVKWAEKWRILFNYEFKFKYYYLNTCLNLFGRLTLKWTIT